MSDGSVNCRPVLSSESVPWVKKQIIFRHKEIYNLVMGVKMGPIPRRTGRLISVAKSTLNFELRRRHLTEVQGWICIKVYMFFGEINTGTWYPTWRNRKFDRVKYGDVSRRTRIRWRLPWRIRPTSRRAPQDLSLFNNPSYQSIRLVNNTWHYFLSECDAMQSCPSDYIPSLRSVNFRFA
jgi:hypothetical protein